ncbi:unnamed protein product [Prunus brigantina]
MNMSVAITKMNDLDKHSIFLPEKYLRDNLPPLNKPRIFYENLLVETKSVNIVHRHSGENTNTIVFSKIPILNVISLEKWWDKFTKDHLAPTKITPMLIPSFDPIAAQPLAISSTN